MKRSRAWMLLRLAWLCAVPLVTVAPGGELSPLTGRLHASPAQLVEGLHPVAEPPRLLEIPSDCVPVALDFEPPMPHVQGHTQQAPPPRALPVEHRPFGAPEQRPVPVPSPRTMRLPAVDSSPVASPDVERLPPVVTAPPVELAPPQQRASEPATSAAAPDLRSPFPAAEVPTPRWNMPERGGELMIDRLQPAQGAPRPVEASTEPSPSSRSAAPQGAKHGDPMAVVNERGLAIVQNGTSLAQRGAFYSARAEFIQALRMVSQALDVQTGDARHSQALADGLRALEEAEDFSPRGSQLEADLDLASIVAGHRTELLRDADLESVTPLEALQRYYGYARERLVTAGGGQPAASQALYGLGRLTTAMAERSPDERRLHGPKAMALHQAALTVDGQNFRAAHELGALMAQYGQWEEARRLLVLAASIAPRPETWHNLAVVHERLGEADLARRARYEVELALRNKSQSSVRGPNIEWVDSQRFAASAPEGHLPAIPAAAAAGRTKNASGGWK